MNMCDLAVSDVDHGPCSGPPTVRWRQWRALDSYGREVERFPNSAWFARCDRHAASLNPEITIHEPLSLSY